MKRIAFLSLALASVAGAQTIKPRPLGTAQATSKDLLGSVTLARALPNGSVIVNDAARRRLLLLDPTLQNTTVIADSTAGSANGYGTRAGALIPYVADSTLFLDATAGSFLVIDPAGRVTRVMSPPRPADNFLIANSFNGFPGFDSKGRMVYRTNYPRVPQQMRDGSIQFSGAADSAPLIRVDLDTRRADTLGGVKLLKSISVPMTMPNGGTMTMSTTAPLGTIDDWALLSDGSVAIVRGQDYHIDWILPDGSKRATEKIEFDWKRLSDDDKLAIVDSIGKARAAGPAMGGGGPTMITSMGGGGGNTFIMGGGGGMQTREAVTAVMGAEARAASGAAAPPAASATKPVEGKAGEAKAGDKASSTTNAPTNGNAAGAPAGPASAGGPGAFSMPAIPAPAVADIPDYMPPFVAASARADADANLWIRTTTPGATAGNVVYDVVNNQGKLIDRVDVPKGMSIVGFGKGGVVYLTQRDAYGVHFVRAMIH